MSAAYWKQFRAEVASIHEVITDTYQDDDQHDDQDDRESEESEDESCCCRAGCDYCLML